MARRIEEGPARRGLPIQARRVFLVQLDGLRGHPARYRQAIEVPILPDDRARVGTAQPRRVLDEGFQHGLEIERRAADDLEDLARGGLLLQGLGKIPVSALELLEQADVLDGDDGLVGERPEELHLALREGPGLCPRDEDRADGMPVPEHGRGDGATPASGQRYVRRVFGIVQDVGNLGHCSVEDGSTDQLLAAWTPRIHALHGDHSLGRVVMGGRRVEDHLAVEHVDGTV